MGPNPLEIFVIAEQFYLAGILAARLPDHAAKKMPGYELFRGLRNMPAAATTCFAFSLELYFKCLIRMGGKHYEKRGHDLVRLFRLVGKRHQATIRRYFRENSSEVWTYLEREYAV